MTEAMPEPDHDAVVATLQFGEQLFELPRRRVGAARVEIALALAAVEAQRLLEALERELDRLVDRRDERTVVRRNSGVRRMIDARRPFHQTRVVQPAGVGISPSCIDTSAVRSRFVCGPMSPLPTLYSLPPATHERADAGEYRRGAGERGLAVLDPFEHLVDLERRAPRP